MRLMIPICTWACLANSAGRAQQLVPNPGFEEVTACPTFASMLNHAAPWFNPTQGTPELYHACAGSGTYAGVPANYSGGYQLPRTGGGFAGLYTFRADLPEFREYIEVPLTEPLVAGRCYAFSMYVNMPNEFALACDAIGVHFSEGPLVAGNGTVLPVSAHIEHPAGVMITDSVGWTAVNGAYTAVGGEDHLTIGNFRPDAGTGWLMFHPGAWYPAQAYLLVDDVSLLPVEDQLDLGPDTTVCGPFVLDATVPGMDGVLWNDGLTMPIRTVEATAVYAVEVTVGQCVLRDTIEVEVIPEPVLDLGPDVALCAGMTVVLNATSDALSTVVWEVGGTGPSLSVDSPGVYRATAVNACGSAFESVVVVAGDCLPDLYIPNAFTPDGDGINDLFAPVFDRRTWRVVYTIHDRWGRLSFEAKQGEPWDGSDLPGGVYVLHLSATPFRADLHGREVLQHITLVH